MKDYNWSENLIIPNAPRTESKTSLHVTHFKNRLDEQEQAWRETYL